MWAITLTIWMRRYLPWDGRYCLFNIKKGYIRKKNVKRVKQILKREAIERKYSAMLNWYQQKDAPSLS